MQYMESVRETVETEDHEDEEMEDDSDEEVDGSESEEDDSDPLDMDAPHEKAGGSHVKQNRVDGSEHSDSGSSRRSAAPSPTDSLIEHTASMQLASPKLLEAPEHQFSHSAEPAATIKERVASDISRQQARSNKYHSKRSTRKIGRPKGSKAKQDSRVKVDRSGVWE